MNRRSRFHIALGATVVALAIVCVTVVGAPTPPAPPAVFLQTSLSSTPVTGKTIRVAAGGDFQAALNSANPGDEIVLQAGATYTGNFVLPANYMAFCMTGLAGHDASGKVTGKPCKRFKLTNNIMGFGLYGPGIDGGKNTFAEAFPDLTWDKNLFVGYGEGRARSARQRNTCPPGSLFEPKQTGSGAYGDADWPAVGFADSSSGDYRLTPTSKYQGVGTDGKDLGVDMDVLNAALNKAP